MIHEKIFSDFDQCLNQIDKDFGIDNSREQNKVLFRAENGLFEKTEPSMKRLLDHYKMDFYVVSPFIDFEEIYTDYYAEKYGLDETEALGFLQHYGFPTDLLDLTPSIETAHFFAHYGNEREKEACIGVFDIETVSNYYEIVDLTNDPYALRPKKQKAWVLRHRNFIYNFKSAECDKFFKVSWYKFKKNSDDIINVNKNKELVYPTEKELAHFFSNEFYSFFRGHNFYNSLNPEQKKLIEEKLSKIHTDIQ